MPCWYFDKEDLELTPSRVDGIDSPTEARHRKEASRLILEAGKKLNLHHETTATAVVLFHRFFVLQSLDRFHRFVAATGCLCIGSKLTDKPAKISDILLVVQCLLSAEQWIVFGSNPQEEVVNTEQIILETIKFDLYIEHPYSHLVKFVRQIKAEASVIESLLPMAWTFVDDGLCLTLCVEYEPDLLAISYLYLAARMLKINIAECLREPLAVDCKWYNTMVPDVSAEIIKDVCQQILKLYSNDSTEKENVSGIQAVDNERQYSPVNRPYSPVCKQYSPSRKEPRRSMSRSPSWKQSGSTRKRSSSRKNSVGISSMRAKDYKHLKTSSSPVNRHHSRCGSSSKTHFATGKRWNDSKRSSKSKLRRYSRSPNYQSKSGRRRSKSREGSAGKCDEDKKRNYCRRSGEKVERVRSGSRSSHDTPNTRLRKYADMKHRSISPPRQTERDQHWHEPSLASHFIDLAGEWNGRRRKSDVKSSIESTSKDGRTLDETLLIPSVPSTFPPVPLSKEEFERLQHLERLKAFGEDCPLSKEDFEEMQRLERVNRFAGMPPEFPGSAHIMFPQRNHHPLTNPFPPPFSMPRDIFPGPSGPHHVQQFPGHFPPPGPGVRIAANDLFLFPLRDRLRPPPRFVPNQAPLFVRPPISDPLPVAGLSGIPLFRPPLSTATLPPRPQVVYVIHRPSPLSSPAGIGAVANSSVSLMPRGVRAPAPSDTAQAQFGSQCKSNDRSGISITSAVTSEVATAPSTSPHPSADSNAVDAFKLSQSGVSPLNSPVFPSMDQAVSAGLFFSSCPTADTLPKSNLIYVSPTSEKNAATCSVTITTSSQRMLASRRAAHLRLLTVGSRNYLVQNSDSRIVPHADTVNRTAANMGITPVISKETVSTSSGSTQTAVALNTIARTKKKKKKNKVKMTIIGNTLPYHSRSSNGLPDNWKTSDIEVVDKKESNTAPFDRIKILIIGHSLVRQLHDSKLCLKLDANIIMDGLDEATVEHVEQRLRSIPKITFDGVFIDVGSFDLLDRNSSPDLVAQCITNIAKYLRTECSVPVVIISSLTPFPGSFLDDSTYCARVEQVNLQLKTDITAVENNIFFWPGLSIRLQRTDFYVSFGILNEVGMQQYCQHVRSALEYITGSIQSQRQPSNDQNVGLDEKQESDAAPDDRIKILVIGHSLVRQLHDSNVSICLRSDTKIEGLDNATVELIEQHLLSIPKMTFDGVFIDVGSFDLLHPNSSPHLVARHIIKLAQFLTSKHGALSVTISRLIALPGNVADDSAYCARVEEANVRLKSDMKAIQNKIYFWPGCSNILQRDDFYESFGILNAAGIDQYSQHVRLALKCIISRIQMLKRQKPGLVDFDITRNHHVHMPPPIKAQKVAARSMVTSSSLLQKASKITSTNSNVVMSMNKNAPHSETIWIDDDDDVMDEAVGHAPAINIKLAISGRRNLSVPITLETLSSVRPSPSISISTNIGIKTKAATAKTSDDVAMQPSSSIDLEQDAVISID